MKTGLIERLLVPKRIRLNRLKKRVTDYLGVIPSDEISKEESDVLNYLKAHDISVFPYEFTNEYHASKIEVHLDPELKLFYTLWEGKKLYYKNGSRKKKAQKYFNSLYLEQDSRSPHCYLAGDFKVNENEVVVDIGAAEGNFSLSSIEKAKHIYLFEPDKEWASALEATFAPWISKVTIVNKIVSGKTSEQSVSLNDFFDKNQPVHFIKADVEGSEMDLLKGADKIFVKNENLKIAICTYHNQEDAGNIEKLLKEQNFTTEFSPGFMLYYYGKTNIVKEPYLRRAVLRAVKK